MGKAKAKAASVKIEGQTDDSGIVWEEKSAEIFKFAVGDILMGTLENIEEFDGGDFPEKCNKYILMTDTGRKSFLAGSVFDGVMASNKIGIGDFIKVQFNGQTETKKGNKVNNWQLWKARN